MLVSPRCRNASHISQRRDLRIVHVVGTLSIKGGGIATAVSSLARAQTRFGADVHVISSDQGSADQGNREDLIGHCHVGNLSDLAGEMSATRIAHLHTVWNLLSYKVRRAADRCSIPLVVSTHGMLEPWCLAKSRLKKQIARYLYADNNLRAARCLHATGIQEAENLRRLGFTNPIAVIPLGVDLQTPIEAPYRGEIDLQWPWIRGKRIVLFLSRIDRKKGLINLAKAWGELAKKHKEWHLVIAGPDQDGHLAEAKAAIEASGAAYSTTFAGPAYGDLKQLLYSACDVFVLPSFSENFGIVVAEALAAGKAVITTKGTPWGEIASQDCGWYIDAGFEPLREALLNALEQPQSVLQQMGLRGQALIEAKYTWPAVAAHMIEVYGWVLGQATRPACTGFV